MFKSTKNLREHLKTHADHGDDLAMCSMPQDAANEQRDPAVPAEHLDNFDDSDEEDFRDPSYLPKNIPDRKRKRIDSITAFSAEVGGSKKLRRSANDLAKEFACREQGCIKRFKTVGRGINKSL